MNRRESLLFLAATAAFIGCEDRQKKEYTPTLSANDKKIIHFGIHPYLNPIDMHRAYQPIMRYLDSNIQGFEFILEASNSYDDFEKKLQAKKFEFVLPNPYQTIGAIKIGYKVIAKMAPDSDFRGIIVARKDRHIRSVEQLRKKSVSFPAPTALAATMMPMDFLYHQGLDVLRDINPRFVGSQYSSILNAYTGDTIAAATWPPPWRKWCKENPQKASQMELVWQTEPLINNSVMVRDDIPQELCDMLLTLLTKLHTTADGKNMLLNAGFDGFAPSNNKEYDVVVEFMGHFEREVGTPQTIAKAAR